MLIPMVVIGGLGYWLTIDEKAASEHQLNLLIDAQLADHAQQIHNLVNVQRQTLNTLLQQLEAAPLSQWRQKLRRYPQVSNLLLVATDGTRLYPVPETKNYRQQRFLERIQHLDENAIALLGHTDQQETVANLNGHSQGWHRWYWQNQLNLLYWRQLGADQIIAAELDVTGLVADIIALLPMDSAPEWRIRLANSTGETLYQWGSYQPQKKPIFVRGLTAPLNGWRLEYYLSNSAFSALTGGSRKLELVFGLSLLGLLLLGLGVYLYQSMRRTEREARQRVSFVNQVSHELKTPLTNIRLYAELLVDEMAEEPDAKRKLDIIVNESQRLSRLIANILSFARLERGRIKPQTQAIVFDEIVRNTLAHYTPRLQERGVNVETDLGAPQIRQVDADLVTQILGNLLSNVEKYAPGCRLKITSENIDTGVQLSVADDGPGIPRRLQKRVFAPFYRVRNDLTEGVSGTGIGLTIARELAQLQGGQLKLVPTETGAQFVLTLP